MAVFNKSLEEVKESDLLALVGRVAESKTLDYKEELHVTTGDEKKEFLHDVSSFANASGGILIYGVTEDAGLATGVPGIPVTDADKEILRLDGIIQTGIEPKIPGLTIISIDLANGNKAMIIKIPQSWASPHMVKPSSKFYTRRSAGKQQLDVSEIRAAFLATESLAERIRNFRIERISKIVSGNTPLPMIDYPRLAVHVVPIGAFGPMLELFGVNELRSNLANMFPMGTMGSNPKNNFDGVVTWTDCGNGKSNSYVQAFRNGTVEAVTCAPFVKVSSGFQVSGKEYEKMILERIEEYVGGCMKLGIYPPFLIMLSMHGVRGCTFTEMSVGMMLGTIGAIDRDDLVVPELLLDDPSNVEYDKLLRTAFDVFWNSAGYSGSRYYNENGKWV